MGSLEERKGILVGVLALLVGGSAGIALLLGEREEAESVGAAATEVPVEERVAADLTRVEPPQLERSAAIAKVPDEVAPKAGEDDPARPGRTFEIAGRWSVSEKGGPSSDTEDGWFEFVVEDDGPRHRVDVRGGEWRTDLPNISWIEPVQLFLGGRGAVPTDAAWATLSDPKRDEPLQLDALWIPSTTLNVVNEAGDHLQDVTVILDVWERHDLHPGDEKPWLQGVDSPITLPLPDSVDESGYTERVWAAAPGYGWSSTEIAREVGGAYTVALKGGSDLHVQVTGIHTPLEPFFRLRRPEAAFDYEGVRYERQLTEDTSFVLDSVPAGPYAAHVEIGSSMRYARALDSLDVIVEPGRDAFVNLDVSGYRPPVLVEVHGLLTVPKAWGLRSVGLYIELMKEPTVDGQTQRFRGNHEMKVIDPELITYRWSFGKLQPGTYAARFNPLGTRFSFEVPPEGMDPVHLEIAPPAHLEVSVIDAKSREPVAESHITWMPVQKGITVGGVLNGAGRMAPGHFKLRAPAGEVDIRCSSPEHKYERRIVDLEPGLQTLEIEAVRSQGFLFSVLDGETKLSLRDVDLQIEQIDGEGVGWLTDTDDFASECRYIVTAPGRYRVDVERSPETLKLPLPLEIDVPAETFLPLILRLER